MITSRKFTVYGVLVGVQGVEIIVGGGAGAEVARVFKIRGKQHESKQNKVKKEMKRKEKEEEMEKEKKPTMGPVVITSI